jgi:hypothetical protein
MDEVLDLKFRQHDDLRALLLSNHPQELVYVESGDLFWGDEAGYLSGIGLSTLTPRQDHKVILQNLASLTVCVPYHSLAYWCLSGAYVTCSEGDDGHPHRQDLETLRGCHRFYYRE